MKTNSKYNMEIDGTPFDTINDCIDKLLDTINDYNKSVNSNTDMHRVVIGDSHIKSFENLLRSMFNWKYYYLFSLVQPDSNSNILKESVKVAVKQLSMNDFLVISCGTNDFFFWQFYLILSKY